MAGTKQIIPTVASTWGRCFMVMVADDNVDDVDDNGNDYHEGDDCDAII